MRPLTRIGLFAGILLAVFAAASLAGAAIDPGVDEPEEHAAEPHATPEGEEHGAHDGSESVATLPGLATAGAGYRLVPDRTRLPLGTRTGFSFRIVDEAGAVVQDFETEHARRMHLIVVRRDFAGFQHLHPEQRADGSWEVDIELDEAGAYRAFADFAVEGASLTLATDLFVAGPFRPVPLPGQSAKAGIGGGYEVEIDSAEPRAGASTPLRFVVSRDGRRIEGVEPYLGSDGHLVALREHDLAFLHTHPEGEPGGPGPISFEVEYPTPGNYRLFLQFKDEGRVRTAAFTQVVDGDRGHR